MTFGSGARGGSRAGAAMAAWRRRFRAASAGPPSAFRSYRYLARRIERDLPASGQARTILLSGACSAAIAIDTALMLGAALADELGRVVLLIDGGIGATGIAGSLGCGALPGWRDLLRDPARDALPLVVHSGRPGLALLPAGVEAGDRWPVVAPDPVARLIGELGRSFDYVLIAQGPAATDSRRLAPAALAERVLLLAAEDETPLDLLDACRQALDSAAQGRVRLLLDGLPPVLPMKPLDGPAADTETEQIMTTATKTPGAKPTHRLYIVTGEGEKAAWKEIAAAWPHRDGKGFSIALDALPLSGKIVMRAITERPAKGKAR